MNVLEEIRDDFAAMTNSSAIELKKIGNSKEVWVLKRDDWYGVGIMASYDEPIFETFANVQLWSDTLSIDGVDTDLIILSSSIYELRNEFAMICMQFLEPGEKGINRQLVTKEPLEWWKKWKQLLGNVVGGATIYSLVGELVVYKYLLEMGETPVWTGSSKRTHDFEIENKCFEVKTTLLKYSNSICINSQYQLKDTRKDQNLMLCRLEENIGGFSVDDLINELVAKHNISKTSLEKELTSVGFKEGRSVRKKKYKVLELRRYKIDKNFPLIKDESFVANQMPAGILKIQYEVDLSGLDYEKII